MGKEPDFAMALGSEQSEQELDYFFGKNGEKDEGKTETETETHQPSPSGKKTKNWNSIRITTTQKASLDQAHQAYRLATGKTISLSDFIGLCVRRALPHISKEAADLMRQLEKR